MDSLIWYTGIFRIKSGILELSQESRNPAKIPKDSESRRRKFIVSGPSSKGNFNYIRIYITMILSHPISLYNILTLHINHYDVPWLAIIMYH